MQQNLSYFWKCQKDHVTFATLLEIRTVGHRPNWKIWACNVNWSTKNMVLLIKQMQILFRYLEQVIVHYAIFSQNMDLWR